MKTQIEHDRKLCPIKPLFLCPFCYTRFHLCFPIYWHWVSPFNCPHFKLCCPVFQFMLARQKVSHSFTPGVAGLQPPTTPLTVYLLTAAMWSTPVYIYIYIYIYSHLQTDYLAVSQLISVARHARCCKLGLKPAQLYVRLSIIPHSH